MKKIYETPDLIQIRFSVEEVLGVSVVDAGGDSLVITPPGPIM